MEKGFSRGDRWSRGEGPRTKRDTRGKVRDEVDRTVRKTKDFDDPRDPRVSGTRTTKVEHSQGGPRVVPTGSR